ncbi:MAG: hypothetical protein ACXVA9_03715 [Bdellovibrionales bacterium]
MFLRPASRLLFSLFITTVITIGGAAQAKSTPSISSEQIKAMNFEQLNKFANEMGQHWVGIQELATRSDNTNMAGIESIHALKNYACIEENIEILFDLMRIEAGRLEANRGSEKVLEEALFTLAEIGSSKPGRILEQFADVRNEVLNKIPSRDATEKIAQWFDTAEAGLKDNSFPALNIATMLKALDKTENGPLVKLARFEAFLKKRIIGQPEVVELLSHLELKSKLYGQTRNLPEAIYLMGLPGTGKDTIAEGWVDALHNRTGAHEQHLFRLPVMKNQSDLWKVSGSTTGYVGSDKFPPFLEFLVMHSDGKYKLEEERTFNNKVTKIVPNPDYQGTTLPGYSSPDKAVVFANEFHNWSREIKDSFLKQALEKGYFSINNPNGGLTEIYVPIRFLLASNEGISLLTAREANGQRFGKALSYEQLLAKWQNVHLDKGILKNEIQSTNGSPNDPKGQGEAHGTSEELMNRIPQENICILRPLSPDDLKEIARISLRAMAAKLNLPSELFDSIDMDFSPAVVDFIQGYHYVPEENARPILARVQSTIEKPFLTMVKEGHITPGGSIRISIDVEKNSDQTQSLVITTPDGKVVKSLIPETLRDKPVAAISDERIDELAKFAELTSQEVFGVESVVERMGDRVLSIANELTSTNTNRPVNVIGVFGLTSTGKTELAKKTAKRVMGKEDELLTLDFSSIQTLHDFKARILGLKDSRGNPIASDFMKAYDRNNGVLVVAFDELANVKDPDLLRELYDFFREGEVTTFSDGKPRKMGGVFAIVTGNAGQEIFSAVPREIPEEVQMAAWKEISDKLSSDVNLQLATLEKYLPWPLIARIGKNNIFFVPPHTYKSLRQLAQLKLDMTLKRIAVNEGRRGFNVGFPSKEEYAKFIDLVIEEGFSLRHQGASIDAFIRDDFEETLKSLLLRNKVPPNSQVVLEFKEKTDNSKADVPAYIVYNVFVDGKAEPIEMKIRRPFRDTPIEKNTDSDLLVAFHEAGHSIVRQALFGDVFSPYKISIIPGVANLANEWVYYAGIASNEVKKDINKTREYVIREIAVFAGGETAERLVSKGQQHSIGKVNDMERASRIARDSVLRYGLSDKWGTDSVPSGVDINIYISNLSEARRQLLESEVQRMVQEGRDLAQRTLELNYANGLIPLGVMLGEMGLIEEQGLKDFYAKNPVRSPDSASIVAKTVNRVKAKAREVLNPPSQKIHTEILSSIQKPKTMANIEGIALEKKQAMYAEVPLPENFQVTTNASFEAARTAKKIMPIDCEKSLIAKK